jgi:adenosylmethionine-8-amino-7-oxononanoate transaminase
MPPDNCRQLTAGGIPDKKRAMKPGTEKLIAADKQYVWHPFTQMKAWMESEPVLIDSAEGFYLIDTEGRRYIDGVSSLWCNVHGHRVKRIDDAIRAQLDKVAHSTLLGLGQTRSIELAEKLVQIAPKGLSRVFYSDSGATAVEIAVKMAFQYWANKGQKKRDKFIALEDSYHGDTIGSVSIGGISTFHSIFHPLLFETYFAPSPHPYRFAGTADECMQASLAAVRKMLEEKGDRIAAVVSEPLVQGAAGMIVHPKGFLRGLRELTREFGVLLICDEVATGFGRTGTMFACEQEGVQPDLMCVAKGITGGYLPLAATLATEEMFEGFLGDVGENKTFYHGHTYTGNALACAAAIASLELFEENRIVESLGEKASLVGQWGKRMMDLPNAGDFRQCGLMAGLELVKDKQTKEPFAAEETIGAKLCAKMRSRGAMMRPLGNVAVLMPPPAMDMLLLDELLQIVYRAAKEDLPKIIKK